ncbi:MAG: glycosyltransferase family 4 protein [Gluconacetobacter diazotrophicus]|nr:glycosyltransferase family 4 protein [Gluconacetobacter diazotrophicus]
MAAGAPAGSGVRGRGAGVRRGLRRLRRGALGLPPAADAGGAGGGAEAPPPAAPLRRRDRQLRHHRDLPRPLVRHRDAPPLSDPPAGPDPNAGLRIGLDGRNRFPGGGGTGVATYAATLAAAIDANGRRPCWLLADRPGTARRAPHAPAARAVRLLRAAAPRRRGRMLADGSTGEGEAWLCPDAFRVAQVHLDLYRRPLPLRLQRPPALMHWTCPLPLRLPGVPEVLTVHDLIPIELPELTGMDGRRLDRLLRRLLPAMARVVTVSETVRQAVIGRYGIAPERVVNTWQAVDLSAGLLRASGAAEQVAPAGSFVAVGSVEPRKNVGRLIRAHGRSGTERTLVLIGPDGVGAAGELAALAGHPHPERVLRLPWLPRPALVRAMRDARAVLFPSLAEGFGLPIAEAMALGVPVLTSRGGATEEIAGGAAILAGARDEAALAAAIDRLHRDDALCAALAERGRRRAELFAPEAYARRVAALHEAVLRESGAGGTGRGR